MLKPKAEREKLPDNSTEIFYNNINDYYRARPLDLNHLCLYEFAMWYVKCEKPKSNAPIARQSNRRQVKIQLLEPFENIYMRKRVKSLIIRLPKFQISSEDYFYSLLMAFFPHRFEEQ